jgi:hypothetical protein
MSVGIAPIRWQGSTRVCALNFALIDRATLHGRGGLRGNFGACTTLFRS